jgi:hypothetical protein
VQQDAECGAGEAPADIIDGSLAKVYKLKFS